MPRLMRSALALICSVAVLSAVEPLVVRSSTTILADWVAEVGGDRVQVTSLIPIGGDPHAYRPSPRETAELVAADLVVIVGSGLEGSLEAVLDQRTGATLRLAPLGSAETTEHAEHAAHDQAQHAQHAGHPEHADHDHVERAQHAAHDHDHHHDGEDPHIWLDVALTIRSVRAIAEALATIDAAHAAAYRARATAYRKQLEQLDAWIRSRVATVPADDRELVTGHDAFGHFARAYGLRTLGSILGSQGTVASEPSPRALAELAAVIRKEQVRALFPEANHSQRLIRALAQETGVLLAPMLTPGSLGAEGSGMASYIGYMRTQTAIIVTALGGRLGD